MVNGLLLEIGEEAGLGVWWNRMLQEIKSHELWKSLPVKDHPKVKTYEESATFWLWAYPSLLGWDREIAWLFSPVTGNTTYPGDLWGIDSDGRILAIETKMGKRKDPFIDFLDYEKAGEKENYINPSTLIERWQDLYAQEKSFWAENKSDIQNNTLSPKTASGILPYSSKRYATIEWGYLYTDVIAPSLFENDDYKDKVKEFIERREKIAEKNIYYFGLTLVNETKDMVFSVKGENHAKELVSIVGKEQVITKWITATNIVEEEVGLIRCGARDEF